VLGLPMEIYPCGGVTDAALAGTSRRWSTGQCSVPVSLICTHRHASPAIILDELEKAGTGRTNGSLVDALLGLLEQRTARRFRDVYLEAAVDLSHVVWLGTANEVHEMPGSLKDRCTVIQFPPPLARHLPALSRHLLQGLVTDRGLDARWAAPLDGTEQEALGRLWHGGSLRPLVRLLEAVLTARERGQLVH
jgi:ATP-dependent Lon protease